MSFKDRDKIVRKMAELLRSGAVMLDQQCPLCGSPLFKLKKSGEIVCPLHGPVRVVKSESEAIEVMTNAILDEIEKVASKRIHELLLQLEGLEGSDEIEVLDLISKWLSILERARRVKQESRK